MSKYNIVVKNITKTSDTSYSGVFSLTDSEHFINGRVVSATVIGQVETIQYNGATIAKIKGTQGQRAEVPTKAHLADGTEVSVVWGRGHRSSVAAAFAALWTEMCASGKETIEDRSNPSGRGKGQGGVVVHTAPVVDDTKVKELEEKLAAAAKAQEEANLRAQRMEEMMMQMMERLSATPTKK